MLKTSLPESITLPCGTTLDKKISYMAGVDPTLSIRLWRIKQAGGKYRLVEVMGRNLRGKRDLHGSPYRPTTWILTNIEHDDVVGRSSK